MAAENPFETRFREYDAWFEANKNVFASEVAAVRAVLPDEVPNRSHWVEIGVGSGRFAAELGIPVGVEPADGIAALAEERGIRVLKGVAEDLPLDDGSVGTAFLITSLCFIDDMAGAFAEVARVLVPGGKAIVAFIPADSPFGRLYETAGEGDPFFRRAKLRPRRDVIAALSNAGLRVDRAVHTLTAEPARANEDVEPPGDGWRAGSFVVLRAVKE